MLVGWEEHALELDPAGAVSAPVVGLDFLIKSGLLAITLVAPSAAPRWNDVVFRAALAGREGGTGKTLVATSLALSLQNEKPVQLLDCDVEEPDAHILLKP